MDHFEQKFATYTDFLVKKVRCRRIRVESRYHYSDTTGSGSGSSQHWKVVVQAKEFTSIATVWHLGSEIYAFHEHLRRNFEKLEKNFRKNSYPVHKIHVTGHLLDQNIILTFFKRHKITVFFYLCPLLWILISFDFFLVAVLREPECHRGE